MQMTFDVNRAILNYSLQLQIAARFGENGLILALGRYESEVPCFDAEWFSCHQHEKEVLFFGGNYILQIRNIYNFEGKWTSFSIEIKAIQAIRSIAKGININAETSSSWELRNMIFDMISTLLDIDGNHDYKHSSYIHELLAYQVRNTPKSVVYDLNVLRDEYTFLHTVFMETVDQRIPNIANLCNLFPRANGVVIEVPFLFEISQDFEAVLMNDVSKIRNSVTLQIQWPLEVGPAEMMN